MKFSTLSFYTTIVTCFGQVFPTEVLGNTCLNSECYSGIVGIHHFKIVGNETLIPYNQFRGLPESICSTLDSLHLEYLEFDPNLLIEQAEGCNELKSVNLINVEWINPVRNKVILPNLEVFNLTTYHIDADNETEFMAHLFFFENSTQVPATVDIIMYSELDGKKLYYNSSSRYLELHSIHYDVAKYFNYTQLDFKDTFVDPRSLQIENLRTLMYWFYSLDHGMKILEALKSAHRLVKLEMRRRSEKRPSNVPKVSIDLSAFPSAQNFEWLLLQYANVSSSKLIRLERIIRFDLLECEFNTTLISVPNSVQIVYLKQVELIGDSLETFLSQKNSLTRLSIRLFRKGFGQVVDLDNVAAASASTLEFLSFEGVHLALSSNLKFAKMDSLYFKKCEFGENFISSFSITFPAVSYIYLVNNNLSLPSFKAILNTPSLETINITPKNMEVPEITTFLRDCGVSASVNGAVLKRSNTSTTGWLDVSANGQYNTEWGNIALHAYILLLITICGFGILGILLNGIVLTRRSMWGSTSCILLGLSFYDSVVLVTYFCSVLYFGIKLILVFFEFKISPDQEDYRILGFSVTESSVKKLDELQYFYLYPLNKTGKAYFFSACIFVSYIIFTFDSLILSIFFVAYTGSVYTTVLLTIERFVAVCWPLQASRVLRTRNASYALLLIFGFSVLLNFPRWIEAQQYSSSVSFEKVWNEYFWTRSLVFQRKTGSSGLLRSRYYRQYYHGLIWVTFMYFVPISGLTFLNLKILIHLRKSKQNRASLMSSSTRHSSISRTDQQNQLASLTKMLLCVIMIFVLCNSVSGLIVWTLLYNGRWDPADIEIFSCIPLILNSSINFAIYTLMGSKFRAVLAELITRCGRKVSFRRNVSDALRSPSAPDPPPLRNNIPLNPVTIPNILHN